jgi:drug/metabolite transporter (DMT)-like permease
VTSVEVRPERPVNPQGPVRPERPARHHDPVAYGLLAIMAVCFAGTWVAAHWATEEIPPLTTAFLRFLVATVLLWIWARLTGVPIRVGRADVPLIAAMGVSGIVLYNLCFLYGVQLAPSSDGAVIVPGLSPVVVAALVAVRYGIRPPGRAMTGLGLALVGLVVVIGPAMTGSPARALGDVLFVVGAACWAVYSVLSRAATVRFHPVAVTLAAAAFGAAAFAPLALLERGWEPLLAATPRAVGSVVYLGALGTVVAFVAFAEGIRRIGAPRASAFIVLVPLLGEVLTFWLLGEEVSGLIVGGTAAVLAGLWLVQTVSRASVPQNPPASRAPDPPDPPASPTGSGS